MVVGADRIREFDVLTNKYNGKVTRHGFYNFETIRIVSAGERDPDAEGVTGMSASKMRAFATDNDFQSFAQGLPSKVNNKDAKKLFNDVRKESVSRKRLPLNHIELPVVSETREQFVKGELFELGDSVVIKETEEVGVVSVLGANYVIVEMTDGKKLRKWLDAVEIVEKKLTPAEIKKRDEIAKSIEKDNPKMPMDKKMAIATATAKRVAEEGKGKKQDPDIKDREGTQPARYHKGLAKSTKTKRDAHFKKHGKKADDDASAYKPKTRDKSAKQNQVSIQNHLKICTEKVSNVSNS